MKKRLLIYFLAILAVQSIYGQKLILPTPSTTPSKAQQQQIARKYGMFIHLVSILSMMRNGRMVPNRPLLIVQPG